MQQYFKEIERKVKVAYSIASQARAKDLDPASIVEIPLATSLAERVTGLVSVKYPQVKDCGIEKRIKQLEKQYGFLEHAICLKIAEEVAKEHFCKFKNLQEAMDAGIRIAFAYITLGVVSSPLEGFTHFKLRKTKAGKDYIAAFYSGPIRSAGTTAICVSLLIIDYLRELFGFAAYDPIEEEVKRMVTELYDYHERVTNLQYLPSEEEIEFLVRHLSLQVDGEPSEEREVSNYKDLERIETPQIRNGPCLVLGEGLAQKAAKALKILMKLRKQGFRLSGWDWLERFVQLQRHRAEEKKEVAKATYIQDIVAGRPILGHPSREGGFRLRYGRTRCSGYSAVAISPATMAVLDNFIAVGTQLKLEKPMKAAAVVGCDSIEGPLVKLSDGSVVQIKNAKQVAQLKGQIAEILYLGDILISYGDFLNRNHPLIPCGYNEEWWAAQLSRITEVPKNEISIESALELSKQFDIPLHPKYVFYWSQLTFEQLLGLLDWFAKAKVGEIDGEREGLTLNLVNSEKPKRALEILGMPHTVKGSKLTKVFMDSENSKTLLANLGIDFYLSAQDQAIFTKKVQELKKKAAEQKSQQLQQPDVLSFINEVSKVKIKDKAGSWIGARMGRPEKAKLRVLTGSPHVLFPVGEAGGRFRSVQEAANGFVEADFPIYYCNRCKRETIYFVCERCGGRTKRFSYCPLCERLVGEVCPQHGGISGGQIQTFTTKRIDVKNYLQAAIKKLNLQQSELPKLVKGVRGTSSADHIPENLAKGILRAQFGLYVNKDGTVRYDAIEVPITQFKPREVRASVEQLRSLGYNRDITNKPLTKPDQILELKPQDIILPACPDTLDEPADKAFLQIAKFIDNELVRFYGLRPFYNAKSPEDLIGHLVVCIAPHNAAGVIGRIIGFSSAQALIASPYLHGAMRRDCDGDEAAVTLLLDTLLNFSKQYLPAHRGATQDATLILNARIRAGEVDDMVFDIDVTKQLPLELYEAAARWQHPSTVKVEQISDRLKSGDDIAVFRNLHCSHPTGDINRAALCSVYKTLATMAEKVKSQMKLAEKIRAVDTADVARLIIERHFIRDIRGNLRKFSSQQFRCVKCNKKFRRPPLNGVCLCGGRIIFTIAEGSIIKYLEPALQLAEKYAVPTYIKQSLELTKRYIESIFGREREKQQALQKWFNPNPPQQNKL